MPTKMADGVRFCERKESVEVIDCHFKEIPPGRVSLKPYLFANMDKW